MNSSEMEVTAHLSELRKTVAVIAAAVVLCSAVMLFFSGRILTFLAERDGYTFMYTSPEMAAAQQLKLAVICGMILSLPVSISALWRFVRPAMTAEERRRIKAVLGLGLLLFACGAVFAFLVIFPIMIRFFKSVEVTGITAYISIAEYMNFLITVCLIFGLIFELPVVMACLAALGIADAVFFSRIRKYAVVIIFFASALVTPSDIFSMLITAVPMLVIYEAGIAVCRILKK